MFYFSIANQSSGFESVAYPTLSFTQQKSLVFVQSDLSHFSPSCIVHFGISFKTFSLLQVPKTFSFPSAVSVAA